MDIINTLNIQTLKQQYEESGYVVIKDLLRDEVARAAYESPQESSAMGIPLS